MHRIEFPGTGTGARTGTGTGTVSGEISLLTVGDPAVGPGKVLVRVEAVGVSVALVRMLAQPSAEPPRPGGELVGTVVEVGDGVERFRVGDRVGGIAGDIFGELVACDPAFLTDVPVGIDAGDAVTLVRGGLIALSVLRAGDFQPGRSVLVTAAASGTGHLVVQLAKAWGAARITAVLGREAGPAPKADLARSSGADEVRCYDEESWGAPVDLVLDAAGGEMVQRGVNALAAHGRLVAFAAGGGAIDAGTLLGNLRTVTGFSIGLLSREEPAEIERRRAELWRLHAEGLLRPAHVDFPFAQAADALELVATRSTPGRVGVRVAAGC